MKTRLRIEELAQARGWSQAELARRTGLNTGTIMKYWHNKSSWWALDVLEKIADALSVTIKDLIADEKP